jgi:hypothetical protein
MREAAVGEGFEFIERVARDGSPRRVRERIWELAPDAEGYAAELAALSLISHQDGQMVGAGELRALYVRLSDAELKEQCRG